MRAFFAKKTVKICAAAAGILAVLAAAFFLAPGAGKKTMPAAPAAMAGESDFAAAQEAPSYASLSAVEAYTADPETAAVTSNAAAASDSLPSSTLRASKSSAFPTTLYAQSAHPTSTAAPLPAVSAATSSAASKAPATTQAPTTTKYVYANTTKAPGTSAAGTAARPSSSSAAVSTTTTTVTTAASAATTTATTAATKKALTATLSIRCDTILGNMGKLRAGKAPYVPSSGEILPAKTVSFTEGETVFDVLKRETKAAGIQMEFTSNPMYNSAYIEGINNLYEFDCGELSGWMYKVNGWFPNYGCSQYTLKQGDVIEWVYTCDLGNDVGGGYATGTQG